VEVASSSLVVRSIIFKRRCFIGAFLLFATLSCAISQRLIVFLYARERLASKFKTFIQTIILIKEPETAFCESWGSALGIFLVDAAPEKYYAFIGTGQMVDFKETEITDYNKVMELAKANQDEKTVQKLLENGMPPYYGADVTWKSMVYLNYLSDYMAKNPEINNGGYHTFRDLFSSEYGIIDSVNYLIGLCNTFNQVYPQLYDIDLRKNFTKLEIPVYFFLGKHDINAPVSLSQEYYDLLEAPKKEIVWFEHSGHNPWMNESELFVNQTVRVFLEK
jgi:pimeloyl-ACP methyl ester carboxylesterase